MRRGTVTDKTVRHRIVADAIDCQTRNLTQDFERTNRAVRAFLETFARKVAHMSINGPVARPDLSADWKGEFANTACDAVITRGSDWMMYYTRYEMTCRFPNAVVMHSMARVSFLKIANCACQVARMILLGLDPELLMPDRRDSERQQLQMLLQMARSQSVPVIVVARAIDASVN